MSVQRYFVRVVQSIFPRRMTSEVPAKHKAKIKNKDLKVFNKDTLLKLSDVMGKYIAILGLRGTGKSNTAAVIVEELLSNSVPVTIVDIDGEHRGLADKYKVTIRDYRNKPHDMKKFVSAVLQNNLAVLFDFSHFPEKERNELLNSYLEELWSQQEKWRIPHFVVVEEAHEFIPQGRRTEVKEVLTRIALRGRKKGLGAVLISQRSAKVDKDVLTQADIMILHKVVHPTDMDVYYQLIPLNKKEVKNMVVKLSTGQAIFIKDNSVKLVDMRLRTTKHGGHTPGLSKIRPLGRLVFPWQR